MQLLPLRLAISLALLGLASAQQPAAMPRGFDLQQSCGSDIDDNGTPWLHGNDYKASFANGAMQFVAALGSRVATPATLTYRLTSIARENTTNTTLLTVPTHGSPAPLLRDRRVSFERGLVVEHYDARPDGVEQSFVFAQRPAGSGDLVVRGAIRTDLQPTTSDSALLLTDGKIGGVQIGAVTGVDAAGRRCRGSAALVEGILELRLPATFVDSATYPLTLDPLFGTTLLVGGTSFDDDDIDVAYDSGTDTYLAVWVRTFATGDREVRGQRITGAGALSGSLLAITSGADDSLAPAVASVHSRNRFVVCWQAGPGPFGPFDIYCRSVAASNGSLGATVMVDGNSPSDVLPAISGNRDLFADDALIVWGAGNNGLRSHSVAVSATGVITLSTTKVVTQNGRIVAPPELPKGRLSGGVAMVAWVEQPLFFALHATAIDYDGDPLITAITIESLLIDFDFAMDGDASQFMVVYDNGSLPNATVRLRPVTWNGSNLVLGTASTLPSTGNPRGYEVGFLGERYLIAWQQPTANPFADQLLVTTVKPNCTLCGQTMTAPTISRPNQRAPAVATHFAADQLGPFGEALLMWNETDALPPFTSSVVGQPFTAMLGAVPVVLSGSCPGGGTGGTNGPFALGNAGFRLTLSGGDANAPLALLSLGLGDPPLLCGCEFTQPLVTYAVPAFAGNADFLFVTPCAPMFLGFQLEYQWLLFGSVASPCPLLQNVTGSDRRLLTLTQ